MSLFNLNEIDIKESVLTNKTTREIENLGLEDKYASNLYRFPLDIGAYDKGHYMIINIGKQLKTKYGPEDAGEMVVEKNLNALREDIGKDISTPGAAAEVKAGLVDIAGDGLNALTNANFNFIPQHLIGSAKSISKSMKEGAQRYRELGSQLNKPSFLRTVRRTTDTIALYMPDTLQFSYNQGYSDLQMNQGVLPLVAAAGTEGVSLVKDLLSGGKLSDTAKKAVKNLSPFVGSIALERLLPGGPGTAISASLFGAVQNPQLELLYSSPEFRQFRFEFMMYPRSQKEALEIQKIIHRLKFHQAPELLQGGPAGGLFLVPPSEFDISFYYNGLENPNIPKISTCVLAGIDTDYAPNGQFAAYEVPSDIGGTVTLGGTGTPVGIRLTLSFKETQILTKFNYSDSPTSTRPERAF